MIDTHTHLDGEEYNDDRAEVMQRAKDAGIEKVFLPGTDQKSSRHIMEVSREYEGFAYPMLGIHPEEVKANWQEEVAQIKTLLYDALENGPVKPVAIGEVGLDYYWSREFEAEQLLAFEEQIRWSVDTRLPLMLHVRKAQNEAVKLLRRYQDDLCGGVFHCFSGNAIEAKELLQFDNFMLGIGGILTFKKSNLPETLATAVPLSRIVLETDAPYLAPVPMRGKRNESAFVPYIVERLAEVYGVTTAEVERQTNENVHRVFAC